MEDLDARFRTLEAEAAIVRLKARYARFADDGYDAEGIAGLLIPDGVCDGGTSLRQSRTRGGHSGPLRSRVRLHPVVAPLRSADQAFLCSSSSLGHNGMRACRLVRSS
jgi:hypothetical protein